MDTARMFEVPPFVPVSVADILQALMIIAFADVRKLVGADGKVKPLDAIDAMTASAISRVLVDADGVPIRVELESRVAALDCLARLLGAADGATIDRIRGQVVDILDREGRAARRASRH